MTGRPQLLVPGGASGATRRRPFASGPAGTEASTRSELPDPGKARGLAASLRRASADLAAIPADELVRILGAACRGLLNGMDDEAVAAVAANSGLSAPMVREALQGMGAYWSTEAIQRMVAADFPDPRVLDGFVPDGAKRGAADAASGPARSDAAPRGAPGAPLRRLVAASGPPLTLVIGAGTVPGVTVTAMIRALVVKSAVLAKPGAGDVALTTRFARELIRADARVGSAAAARHWPGGAPEWDAWERELLGAADQVVVHGSDRTIESVRARAPATTRLIEHPNRLGVAAVDLRHSGAALAVAGPPSAAAASDGAGAPGGGGAAAAAVARAATLFEQRGCVSTQLVLLMTGGRPPAAARWCALLAERMAALEDALPPPPAAGARAAVHQLRGRIAMRAAARAASPGPDADHPAGAAAGDPRPAPRMWHRKGSSWTVVLASADEFQPVGGRTVWVVPAPDSESCLQALSSLGPVLQTVGLAGFDGPPMGAAAHAGPARGGAETNQPRERFARRLAELGVTRIVPLDQVPFPESDWLHDGSRPLGELVRWTELR